MVRQSLFKDKVDPQQDESEEQLLHWSCEEHDRRFSQIIFGALMNILLCGQTKFV